MAAYGIFNVEVIDAAAYEKYKAGAAPTIAAAGGKYIVRGGETRALEGGPQLNRIIVLEFASKAAFDAWYDGPDYAPWRALRQECARTVAFSVVGA
jgi:uncharacterized protein (DUF1330 family)